MKWSSAGIRDWISINERALSLAGLILALIVGSFLRLVPTFSSDFPLNDGGLFYLMAQELQNSHYALPAYTSYNSEHIPFTYPPLGLYVTALLSDTTGWPLLGVMRVLPAVLSTLTIPVFFILGRTLLDSWAQASFATFAFALLPRSFEWFIMGGGVTRAPGFLFALITIHQAYLLFARDQPRFLFSTVLFASLTVLTHAEKTWFVIYSMALLFVFYGRNRKAFINSFLIVVGVLTVTAPWWAIALSRHGLSPFLSAAQSGGGKWVSLWPLKTFYFTEEPLLPLFAVLGLLGLFMCLANQRWLLPAWIVTIFLLQPRAAETPATVPLALLVGIAVDRMVIPAVSNPQLFETAVFQNDPPHNIKEH